MKRLLLTTLGLTVIYLLVLTSIDPADVLSGAVLSLLVAWALVGRRRPQRRGRPAPPAHVRIPYGLRLAGRTARQMVVGSWLVARYCVRATGEPRFVEIPRAGRSDRGVALWGLTTGLAPDEIPVDVDDERGVLIVQVICDESDDEVANRHMNDYENIHRRVVP